MRRLAGLSLGVTGVRQSYEFQSYSDHPSADKPEVASYPQRNVNLPPLKVRAAVVDAHKLIPA